MKKYSAKVNSYLVCNGMAIEIVSKDVDKANSVSFIAQLEDIAQTNIYTIGDNYTDIEMIKKFNGFTMFNSIKELKNKSIKEYKSVSNLIFDVMSNNK